MPNLDDFVFGLAFGKPDIKNLRNAEKRFQESEDKRTKQVKTTSRRIARIRDQLTKTTDKTEKTRLRRQLRNLQQFEKRAKAAYRSAAKEARDAGRAATKATAEHAKTLSKFKSSLRGGVRGAAGLVGGAVGAAAVGLAELTRRTIENTTETDRWARTMGVGIKDLSSFEQGMKLARIPIDNSREAVKTLRENLGELARVGTGPALDSLGSLGLKLEDLKDLGVEDQMALLSDAIRGVEDPSKQLSIAIELMGEDGRFLLPVLRDGGQAVRELGRQARETGAVLDEKMVAKTRELDEQMAALEAEARGVGLSLAEALLPAVRDGAEGMAGFVEQNDDFIKQDLPTVVREIGGAFAFVATQIADASRRLSGFAEEFADLQTRRELEGRGGLFEDYLTFGISGAIRSRFSGASDDSVAASQNTVGHRGVMNPARAKELRGKQRSAGRVQRGLLSDARHLDQLVSDAHASGRAADQLNSSLRAGFFEAGEQAPKSGSRRKPKGSSGRKDKIAAALLARAQELFGGEINRIAEAGGAQGPAIDSALEAAAREFGRGSNNDVARAAALRRLGSSTGTDYNKAGGDPLLSEIFGDNVPDVELSKLARGAQPQTLVSNINNTFSFDIDNAINGAGNPADVAAQVTQEIRNAFEGSIEKSTKTAAVKFVR